MSEEMSCTCPLCEEQMEYKALITEERITHSWVCPECPAVLYEYYDNKDTENLLKFIK